MYNFIDKILSILFKVKKPIVSSSSGLVQDIEHSILPTVYSYWTFILSLIFMVVSFILKNYEKILQKI